MNFNFDNKFFRALGKLFDCIVLSLMWLALCIPVITIGASTTALYYTVHKVIRRSRGYLLKDFWDAFKDNFKQSTVMWLIMLVIYGVLGFDTYFSWVNLRGGSPLGNLFFVFLILLLLMIVWNIYIFGYTARFNNTNRAIMKNAAILAVAHLPVTVMILIVFLICCYAVYLIPPMILIIPTALFIVLDGNLEKIFRKYMTEEDLKAEEEADKLDQE